MKRLHPFYVEGKGWTGAGELKEGDKLNLITGESVSVYSVVVERCIEPVKLYNFEVEDFHTYYVGYESVLVHNKCTNTNWINKTHKNFWKVYNKLPKSVQKMANKAYKLFKADPNNPGLNFEQLEGGKYYSVRINKQYRAYGRKLLDGTIEWVEINAHDYKTALRILKNLK